MRKWILVQYLELLKNTGGIFALDLISCFTQYIEAHFFFNGTFQYLPVNYKIRFWLGLNCKFIYIAFEIYEDR